MTGVTALTGSVRLDLHSVVTDVTPDAVSTFVDHLELVIDGSDGLGCLTATSASLTDDFTGPGMLQGSDGVIDTVLGQKPGAPLCTAIVTKAVGLVQTGVPQFFEVDLSTNDPVVGVARSRRVVFMVPPRS
jgi:hypothetical protein